MAKNVENITSCRSIFKDGRTVTSKEVFTRKWIEMVNHIERDKTAASLHECP